MNNIKKFEELDNSSIEKTIMEDGKCYVFVQGNDINIEHFYDLVRLSKHDKIILYPEQGMRFVDVVEYIPYVKSVVTENPYIISCYDKKNVFILQDDVWVNPNQQTYGASVNMITVSVIGYINTIPHYPLGGELFSKKLKNRKNYG